MWRETSCWRVLGFIETFRWKRIPLFRRDIGTIDNVRVFFFFLVRIQYVEYYYNNNFPQVNYLTRQLSLTSFIFHVFHVFSFVMACTFILVYLCIRNVYGLFPLRINVDPFLPFLNTAFLSTYTHEDY